MNTLYTARATVAGGRNGHAASDDGQLSLQLAMPKALGGTGAPGTNPEQLFAAGYAACFDSALHFVAGKAKRPLSGTQVEAQVGIGPDASGGFALAVSLTVSIPGVPEAEAQRLIDEAHRICPYSNAIRGNVAVTLALRKEPA